MKKFWRNMLPGLWLMTALPISALILVPIGEIFDMSSNLEDPILAIGFVIGHTTAGYLWARALLRQAGLPASKMAYVAAGIGFAISVIGVEVSGDFFTKLSDLPAVAGTVHLEFGLIFVTWTGIVTAVTGLALGLGLKAWRLAFKLFASGFLTGASVFLIVALLMDGVGFRVGVVRADGIPSMPVVTLLGIWLAALIGTSIYALILTSSDLSENDDSMTIPEFPDAMPLENST